MGRWAAAKRRGGGKPAALAAMVSGTKITTFKVEVIYNLPINAALLTAADFILFPTPEIGDSILQTGSSKIEITFLGSIVTKTSLSYAGDAFGFKTPDQISV